MLHHNCLDPPLDLFLPHNYEIQVKFIVVVIGVYFLCQSDSDDVLLRKPLPSFLQVSPESISLFGWEEVGRIVKTSQFSPSTLLC